MARHEPVQARSVDSMNRMLDAGAELFLEGGSASLKVELIVEASGCSTGSFYARFGDMHGYLVALHQRTLDHVESEFGQAALKAAACETLEATLESMCGQMLAIVKRSRAQLYFFAVGNSHDAAMRSAGAAMTVPSGKIMADLLRPFLTRPVGEAARRRLDMVVRMFIAMAFQQIMLEQTEVSTRQLGDRALAREWAATLATALDPFVT
jgi:AcrR family transcriptional regulator